MAFCVKCGAQMEGRFCQACGASAEAGSQPGPTYTSSSVGAAGGLSDNVAGALCYLLWLVTGILFLLISPYNRNRTVRFHAFQAIFFNLAWIAFWMVLSVLAGMLHGFGFLLLPIYPLAGFGGFLLWLYLMYRAYNNNPLVLPVIGPLAEQQAASSNF